MATYDVIIVGSGPAGMTAAIYAARANMSVLLVEKCSPGGQIINTNEIQNYTGVGTIEGAELAMNMFSHTQELNVEFDLCTVTKIEDHGELKRVLIEEDPSRILEAKTVIIATGNTPRRLHVKNEETFIANGISFCAICDGPYYAGKNVVVCGGGNSAVEESLYLSEIVNHLSVVTLYDLTADPMVCDQLRTKENVDIYEYQEIKEFVGTDVLSGVRFVSTKTNEETTISCDGVFEYIGLEPVTEFVKDLGITNTSGFIEVNEKMETKIAGIYAAGDCIVKNLRQVITACADGAIAAQECSKYVKR